MNSPRFFTSLRCVIQILTIFLTLLSTGSETLRFSLSPRLQDQLTQIGILSYSRTVPSICSTWNRSTLYSKESRNSVVRFSSWWCRATKANIRLSSSCGKLLTLRLDETADSSGSRISSFEKYSEQVPGPPDSSPCKWNGFVPTGVY